MKVITILFVLSIAALFATTVFAIVGDIIKGVGRRAR